MLIKNLQFEPALKMAFDLNLKRGFVNVMDAMCAHYDHCYDPTYLDVEEDFVEFKEDPKKSLEMDAILQNSVQYFMDTDLRRFCGILMVLITANKYSDICALLLNHLLKVPEK